MADQEQSNRSEDNAAADAGSGRESAEQERRNRYTDWLREQLGETATPFDDELGALDPYGRRIKR